MDKLNIINGMNKTFARVNFQVMKHSPEIFLIAGLCGVVASTVMACKATTKINTILSNHKKDIETIHTYAEDESYKEEYSEEDSKKDLLIVYTQTAFKFLKLYGPAVAVGILSIGCILASNNIMRARNIALASAYATIDKGFKEYRNRVIERFGKDVDHELKYNIKAKKFEETIVDEKGKEKKVEKAVDIANLDYCSEYARFFDAASRHWEDNSEYNLMYARLQQQYANNLLRSRGYLFLNEVYNMFDIPISKAGQIVGWTYDLKNPKGDNYVDFGIYKASIEKLDNTDFVNGYEPAVLLDFNVDGDIWSTIEHSLKK